MAVLSLSLEGLAAGIGAAFGEVEAALAPDEIPRYFARLGIGFPSSPTDNSVVAGALAALRTAAGNVKASAQDLLSEPDPIAIITKGVTVLADSASFQAELGNVQGALVAQAGNLGLASADVLAFAADFPTRARDAALIGKAEQSLPGLAAVFSVLGVFERSHEARLPSTDRRRDHYPRRHLALDRLVDAIKSPGALLQTLFGIGGPAFGDLNAPEDQNGVLFLRRLAGALDVFGGFTAVTPGDDGLPELHGGLVTLGLDPSSTPPGFRLRLPVPIRGGASLQVPISTTWSVRATTTGAWPIGLGVRITPAADIRLLASAALDSKVDLQLVATPPAGQKFQIFGVNGGARLEASEVSVGVNLTAAWNGSEAVGDVLLTAALGGLKATVDLAEGDGFLSSLASGGNLSVSANVAASYGLTSGFSLETSGLEVNIPLHASFAGIELNGLILSLPIGVSGRPGLPIDFATSLSATFGPFNAVVDRVGLRTDLTFGGANPNLGLANLSAGFKAPTGIGLSLDGGSVSGGGFLSFEEAIGRYSGALELRVFSVSVKAFGVLDTQFPDGSSGFSLVVVIVAEFTPIQLGFGFTLVGVGGLLGLNRSVNAQALGDAVRTGSLAHLLFPRNPVQDAPAIIHDLATVFPAARGHYIFGPMAKLGWGTPTLITADLGIVIEFPGPRIAVLGVVRMLLPSPDFALLRFQLAVLGLLDFPARTFSLDASLFDSTVAGYVVTGDMAYRLGFGANAAFLLSVGGFNPGFQAPPAFPPLRRASVDLGVSGNPSLVASGYFALTSNTAQIGANIELRASGFGIRLEGHLGFDVLFVFSPFSFTATISAGVRVSFHGVGFGITLRGSLSGPTPWHVNGRVCVSVLWWDACLPVDVKFGRAEPAALPEMDPWEGTPPVAPPEVVDPRIQVLGLRDAIFDPRNWSGSAPPAGFSVVSLADAATQERTPIDPLGAATLRQKVVPLRRELEKFGEYKPISHTLFDSVVVAINDVPESNISFVEDDFAPAHFTELTGAQRLSMPSYEKMDAGFSIAPDRVTEGAVGSATLEYETAFITAAGERFADAPGDARFKLTHELLLAQLERSAAGLGGVRRTGSQRYMLPLERAKKVVLARETFVVADSCSHVKNGATGTYTSRSQALLALRAHERSNPTEVNRFSVIPELAVRAA